MISTMKEELDFLDDVYGTGATIFFLKRLVVAVDREMDETKDEIARCKIVMNTAHSVWMKYVNEEVVNKNREMAERMHKHMKDRHSRLNDLIGMLESMKMQIQSVQASRNDWSDTLIDSDKHGEDFKRVLYMYMDRTDATGVEPYYPFGKEIK